MTRTAVLGCILAIVAACGGGSGSSGIEETMRPGPQENETSPAEPAAAPTLAALGAYETSAIGDAGNGVMAIFHRWGVWGGILRDDAVTCTAIGCPPPGDTIFMAYMNHEIDGTVSTTTQGVRSRTTPVTGNAVWIGDVAAYETENILASDGTSMTVFAPVQGDARLEVDFAATTVDVDLTDFDNGRADMSWDGLVVNNGAFGNAASDMEGAFYGAHHEGVAGRFARDGLAGVFGALRHSE